MLEPVTPADMAFIRRHLGPAALAKLIAAADHSSGYPAVPAHEREIAMQQAFDAASASSMGSLSFRQRLGGWPALARHMARTAWRHPRTILAALRALLDWLRAGCPPPSSRLAAARRLICRTCEHYRPATPDGSIVEHCAFCGCAARFKLPNPAFHCPLPAPRW